MFDHLLANMLQPAGCSSTGRALSNALATGAATSWLERYQWLGTRGHGWIGEASEQEKYWKSEVLVGGLEHGWIMTFHILGIIIPIDEYFSEGLRPPTSKGVLQILFVVPDHLDLISRYSIYSWIPAIVEPVQKYQIFKFSLWASSALIWKRFLTAISGFSSRGCSCQDVIPFPKSILWGWKCFLLNDWIHLSMSYWYPNCCLPLLHTPCTIFEVFFWFIVYSWYSTVGVSETVIFSWLHTIPMTVVLIFVGYISPFKCVPHPLFVMISLQKCSWATLQHRIPSTMYLLEPGGSRLELLALEKHLYP